MSKFFKKFFVLCLVTALCFVMVSCAGKKDVAGEESPAFADTSLDIVCEDGKIFVRGSFSYLGTDALEYTVKCQNIKDDNKPLDHALCTQDNKQLPSSFDRQ